MINQKKTSDRSLTSSNSGFTLIEQLIIIFIIGVLGAIAIPSWLGFIYRHRLASSTGQLQWAFKMAQSDAKREPTKSASLAQCTAPCSTTKAVPSTSPTTNAPKPVYKRSEPSP
ncbi:type II secretion system GspH family protein [Planktothrix agardhii 1033]|nr:type II secretion system GspH family protein [Planktothrix agardhii 1033]